ncbi:hypothetical protein C448_00737 [Halococcus morrhuae DSM 1307]|uniref:DUF7964 domain-containing protein n=1 Tax=Halococcus morrhuae DSM 1307 TaxID=931277 RepID=M0N1A2_HALMO|nr:hypothetical protein [Halococcus morrhuae]EMA51323.1 hypothetical protein C448_00737 [Halococcus morrhuae DSM 1307]
MVDLATELPDESLAARDVDRLRERPAVRSVIELPTSYEHGHDVTSTATVLTGGTVLYLTFDREREQWKQRVLARDANERELLEATLDQFEAG